MTYYVSTENTDAVCEDCGARVLNRTKHDEFHQLLDDGLRLTDELRSERASADEYAQEYGSEPVHCDESCDCRASR